MNTSMNTTTGTGTEPRLIACFDIGGTAIKYGLMKETGEILWKKEIPTDAHLGGGALADRITALASEIKEETPSLAGVAISSAGVIDTDRVCVIYASDLIPGYTGTDYRQRLEDTLSLPVEAENDVNCAGLAESWSGAARDAGSAVVLTIGTGIGGCFLQQGEVLHGSAFSACEVGYLPMEGGTFQQLASTTALVKDVAARKGEDVALWNGRKIFEAAKAGDSDCQEAIERLCDRLGQGLASLAFILNPDVFALGGGIMAQEAVLRPLIEESFARHTRTLPLASQNTRIAFAAHQNEAGMRGALRHFLQKHPRTQSELAA